MTSASSFLKGQPPAAVTRLGEACLACACITVPCLAPARPPARAGNSNTRGLSSRPRRRFCAFAGTSRCGARPGPAARPVPRTGRYIYTPTVAPSSRAGVTEGEGASGHATTRAAHLRVRTRSWHCSRSLAERSSRPVSLPLLQGLAPRAPSVNTTTLWPPRAAVCCAAQDPHYLATMKMDSSQVVILDIRCAK